MASLRRKQDTLKDLGLLSDEDILETKEKSQNSKRSESRTGKSQKKALREERRAKAFSPSLFPGHKKARALNQSLIVAYFVSLF
ncbi:hypothetical protein NDU88_011426 [Pleurodeles waltl]|uniref:Uncharacterized protein n=1 Tax=Pleurodeles waltl TaxID=8319 RepID=A0AAV7QZ41_PLEWA|nr:hypothetical protein NDU88_011426 [Pleurodeles waltl]